MRLVELTCTEYEIESRLVSTTRKEFAKLRSVDLYRKLRAEGFFTLSDMPPSELVIDTSHSPVQQSVESILAMLGTGLRG